jgi:hypothetical protein
MIEFVSSRRSGVVAHGHLRHQIDWIFAARGAWRRAMGIVAENQGTTSPRHVARAALRRTYVHRTGGSRGHGQLTDGRGKLPC